MTDLRNFILYCFRLHALAFSLKSRPVQLFGLCQSMSCCSLESLNGNYLTLGQKPLSGLVAALVVWCEQVTGTPDRWLEVSALLCLRGSTRRRALKILKKDRRLSKDS